MHPDPQVSRNPGDRRGPSSGSPGQDDPGDLLDVNEVAAALRVSKMTVYRFIHDGRLPAMRVGNSFRLYRSELTAFVASAFVDSAFVDSAFLPAQGRGIDADVPAEQTNTPTGQQAVGDHSAPLDPDAIARRRS